ncbi:MAG: acylneuraminate cytidylyltransferase family protein [Bacteroidia bacterium]|nr:acylneuraminate cytidylyltransferase family protein [Bacteroidia bacterium]
MNILTIIPARGGSKGIPGKNIIDVCGKPLIAYSIIPALNVLEKGLVQKVIVSTDSEEIAAVAKSYGADVPFLRPDNISGDKAKSVEFILHAINYFEELGEFFDAVLLLQPTSPLRTEDDLTQAINLYRESKNDSLISAFEEEYINDLVIYKMGPDGKTSIPVSPLHNKGVRRQDHGSTYVRNGCIYISSINLIKAGYVIGEQPLMYVMDKNKSVNVDTLEDLELLRKLL